MATTGRRRRLTQSGLWAILEWPAQAFPPRDEPATQQVVQAEWHVTPLCNRDQIWLRDHFQDRLNAMAMGIEWCSYPLALASPDFFLRGYLKSKVYKGSCKTVADLKEAVEQAV